LFLLFLLALDADAAMLPAPLDRAANMASDASSSY
jgi:hypothetical protein